MYNGIEKTEVLCKNNEKIPQVFQWKLQVQQAYLTLHSQSGKQPPLHTCHQEVPGKKSDQHR